MELNLNDFGEGAAFVPLLESYFKEFIYIDCDASRDLIDYYRATYIYPTNKGDDSKYISMGIREWDGEEFIFLWKVSDIFYMIEHDIIDSLIKRNVIILCNLATHVQEVQKLGLNAVLINPLSETKSRLPKLIKRPEITVGLKRFNSIVNPKSGTPLKDLLLSHTFIKYYTKSYSWDDDNYANEFCEVYHLANILEAKVMTAITKSELTTLKRLANEKNK